MIGALAEQGFHARTIAVGSLGGVGGGATRRMRPRAGAPRRSRDRRYNAHLLAPGFALVKGWQRMQGVVLRPGDARFEAGARADGASAALADPPA